MALVWLIVLVVYGMVVGFESIPPLMWWLLIPMASQDLYDLRHKRRYQ